MAQSYDTSILDIGTPQDIVWARNWYRFLSGDKPINDVYPEFSLQDEEIDALLWATRGAYLGIEYYLPQEALVAKILSDPGYASQVSEEGYSATFRDAQEFARAFRSTANRHFGWLYPEQIQSKLATPTWKLHPRF